MSAATGERAELRDAVQAFIAAEGGVAAARGATEADLPYDRARWQRSAKLGLVGLLVPEVAGGQGAELADMAVVATEFGRVLMPSPLVGSAVLASRLLALGGDETAARLLPQLASGELVAAVAMLEDGGSWTTPLDHISTVIAADGDRVTGTKTFVLDADQADVFIVVALGTAGEPVVGAVPTNAPGVRITPLHTLDRSQRMGRVEFDAAPFETCGHRGLDWRPLLDRARQEATLVACAQAVGAARAALQLAVDYIKVRRQFGRVIGSFQAVKHLAASALVEIELADAAVDAAIAQLGAGGPAALDAVAVAKVQASAAIGFAAREALHLHGGIGFTAEHDIHLYLRRAKAMGLLFGTSTEYRAQLAGALRDATPAIASEPSAAPPRENDGDGEEGTFRLAARRWLEQHARPRDEHSEPPFDLLWHVHSEEDAATARAWNRAKFEHGWAGLTWPTEYGGQGRSRDAERIWREEVQRFDTPESGAIVGPSLAGPMILQWGSELQKAELIPAILDGTHLWTQLFSEPEAGSDLAGLRTAARQQSDGSWRLDGQKVWSSVAQFADRGLLLARTDPEAEKHHGISCFVITMRQPGITVRPIRQINGDSTFNEVFFDGVVIPGDSLLGPEGEGWKVALGTLANERVELGVRKPFNLDRVIELARRIAPPGHAAFNDPTIMNRLIDVHVRLTALDALARTDRAASGRIGSVVKLVTANLMSDAAELAVDLQGIAGVLDGPDATDDGLWQRGYLGVQARRIAGGTDEIQRSIIGERLLGLPREPRASQ